MDHIALRYLEYAAGIFGVSAASGLIPVLRRWSPGELQFLISLSAGIVLGVLFFDLLPESRELSPYFFVAMLLGFMLLLTLEKFVLIHPHETEELAGRRSGFAAYTGISLHALLDGVALASSVMMPSLGSVVLWAILAHKIPDTFSLASILIFFKFSRRQVLLLVFVFSLVTPLGGAIAMLGLHDASPTVLGLTVGLAAGTFLFIATSDLLPHAHAHHERRFQNLMAVLGGLLVSWLLHLTHVH